LIEKFDHEKRRLVGMADLKNEGQEILVVAQYFDEAMNDGAKLA
jgi:hypothetical protein